jgi:hypothetical protein
MINVQFQMEVATINMPLTRTPITQCVLPEKTLKDRLLLLYSGGPRERVYLRNPIF